MLPKLKGKFIMKTPTMVYRSPASLPKNAITDRKTGKTYEHQVVDAEPEEEGGTSALDDALSSGWYGSPKEAIAAADGKTPEAPVPDDNAPPTRAELEEKAFELGVVFDDKMKDKTLKKKISEAIETNKQDSGEFL